jgi:hypothetical protein
MEATMSKWEQMIAHESLRKQMGFNKANGCKWEQKEANGKKWELMKAYGSRK